MKIIPDIDAILTLPTEWCLTNSDQDGICEKQNKIKLNLYYLQVAN